MAKNDIEIYMMADGFWAGHMKKDGTLAAGAYRLTGEDIMTMFTGFFTDYCRETGSQRLLMQDAQGALFVTMKVPRATQASPQDSPVEDREEDPEPAGGKKPRRRRKED